MILILLLAIIVIPNIILTTNNMIPFNITIISTLLIINVALPIIELDIKNDLDIKNMHQYYLKEKKIPEYKVKTKNLNVCLIISIAVLIIWAIITIPNITKTENLSEIENTLVITTNNGNNIETQYEMFDGFKIKIPSEFKIMSDEILNVKYPNGNAPSLVYTNDKTTINVVLVMNDVTMKNNQIEEYVKTMESTYKNYSKDVKLKFWERNNHKIGEMKFTTEGSCYLKNLLSLLRSSSPLLPDRLLLPPLRPLFLPLVPFLELPLPLCPERFCSLAASALA